MTLLPAWALSIGATLMAVLFLIQMGKAWLNQDWPRMCFATVGAIIFPSIVINPGLLTDFTGKLADQVLGDIAPATETPAPHATPSPAPHVGAPDLPWTTISLVLGAVMTVIALLLAISSVIRRRRTKLRAEQTRADEVTRRRTELELRHDAILEAYGDFQMNQLHHLDRLALADVNVDRTAQLIDALDATRDARISTAPEALDAYRTAVTALELAWKRADHYARAKGADYLPEAERRNIEQAKAALAIALDAQGHAPERQLALRRALRLIESVIPVPGEAITALEASTRLALDAA
ncbi:hypothetical protein [Streptomyces sp. NPDC055912]|uniref:hypothetical protein n=1 Tax=Streptomyces sp. NPDC055912 TaxID=3345660 RepID=UPI0035DAAC2B